MYSLNKLYFIATMQKVLAVSFVISLPFGN